MTNALQSTAYRMIKGKGTAVTFTRIAEGAYDTSTGSAANTATSAATYAVLDNYSGIALREGVEAGDKRLWVPGLGLAFVPQAGDKVLADGVTWVVVRVDKVNPDAVVYMYDVQVRR
jgi:hypothetical protein